MKGLEAGTRIIITGTHRASERYAQKGWTGEIIKVFEANEELTDCGMYAIEYDHNGEKWWVHESIVSPYYGEGFIPEGATLQKVRELLAFVVDNEGNIEPVRCKMCDGEGSHESECPADYLQTWLSEMEIKKKERLEKLYGGTT